MRAFRRIGIMVMQAALLAVALGLTRQVRGPVFSLNQIAQLNSGLASSVAYHTSPAFYFQDVYYVFFDPLPFNAHGAGQYVAALENTILLTLIILSFRRLKTVARASFMRPYVMTSLLYCAIWAYLFAALGNLGLIDRERVLMLPFLLVLLCIPVSPKGSPPMFPWETARERRRRRSKDKRKKKRPKKPSGEGDLSSVSDLLSPARQPGSDQRPDLL